MKHLVLNVPVEVKENSRNKKERKNLVAICNTSQQLKSNPNLKVKHLKNKSYFSFSSKSNNKWKFTFSKLIQIHLYGNSSIKLLYFI